MGEEEGPRINEDWLEEQKEDHELLAIFNAYGLPEVTDITTTEYGPTKGVEVQPQWDIPDKVSIAVAMTGAFFSKRQNPNHPVQPEEIRDQARSALEAGAPKVHFHVRDPETELCVVDNDLYHEVLDPIQEEYPDRVYGGFTMPFQEGDWEVKKQIYEDGLFEVSPVNTTAVFCGDSLLVEPPDELIAGTRLMKEYGIKPQMAVYTQGDVDNARRYLIEPGVVEEPYFWIVLEELPGGTPMYNPSAMCESLVPTIRRIREVMGDKDHEIVVCASGRASCYVATLSMLLGCHIRVGTEDTIYKFPHKDDRIEDNGEEFKKYETIANLLGREVMTSDEYREMIGLK